MLEEHSYEFLLQKTSFKNLWWFT